MRVLELVQVQTPLGIVTKKKNFNAVVGKQIKDACHLRNALDALDNPDADPKTCEIKFKPIGRDHREGYVFIIPTYEADIPYFKSIVENVQIDGGRVFKAFTNAELDPTVRIQARSAVGGAYMAELLSLDTCKRLIKQTKANGLRDLEEDQFKFIETGIAGEGTLRYAYIKAQVDKSTWEMLKTTGGGVLHVSTEKWRIWGAGKPLEPRDPWPLDPKPASSTICGCGVTEDVAAAISCTA